MPKIPQPRARASKNLILAPCLYGPYGYSLKHPKACQYILASCGSGTVPRLPKGYGEVKNAEEAHESAFPPQGATRPEYLR